MIKRKWYEKVPAAALAAMLVMNNGGMGISSRAEIVTPKEHVLDGGGEKHTEELAEKTLSEKDAPKKELDEKESLEEDLSKKEFTEKSAGGGLGRRQDRRRIERRIRR